MTPVDRINEIVSWWDQGFKAILRGVLYSNASRELKHLRKASYASIL